MEVFYQAFPQCKTPLTLETCDNRVILNETLLHVNDLNALCIQCKARLNTKLFSFSLIHSCSYQRLFFGSYVKDLLNENSLSQFFSFSDSTTSLREKSSFVFRTHMLRLSLFKDHKCYYKLWTSSTYSSFATFATENNAINAYRNIHVCPQVK